ncbi:MAG TPA: hypothetical protein VFE47_31270 [Tepidisphaeraceae bacterium]|nr:hypothetical protein [Tepidisphaeraceae bacterium]
MVKKTVKRPSVHGKPARSAKPAPAKSKKPAVPIRAAVKPAKKPLHRVIAKPAAKVLAKAVAPGKFAEKSAHKGKDRPAKVQAEPSRPPAGPAALPQQSSNGKSRRNLAGFTSRELEHFRDLLLAKRRELIGDMRSMEGEALRIGGGSNLSNLPIHMADMGTDNYEQEFTLGLVQKERDLLKEINFSLAKIQNGTYGLCEGTNLPILKERLEYQPWARFSVEHQRKMERHGR